MTRILRRAEIEAALGMIDLLARIEEAFAAFSAGRCNVPPVGELLMEKGETQRALELFRQSLELAPQAAVIRLNYARALIKAGQKSEAKKQLDEVAKLGDKFPAQAEVAELQKGL